MLTSFQRSRSDAVARLAAPLWGRDAWAIEHIADSGNCVYLLSHGHERIILRLTNPAYRSFDENDAEMEYLHHLHACGVRVAVPIASLAGRDVERIEHDGAELLASAITWAPGLAVMRDAPEWNAAMLRAWGAALARIHDASGTHAPKRPGRRWQWADEVLLTEAHALIPEEETDIHTLFDELCGTAASLPQGPEAFGMVHADFAPQNFRYDPDREGHPGLGITAFDFGNCCYHWYASDVAISLSTLRSLPAARRAECTDSLLEGYLGVRPFAEAQLAWLPLFTRLRILYVYLSRLMKFGPEPSTDEHRVLVTLRAAVRESDT